MKKEKEPKDLLLECLTDIEKDLIDAKDDASKSRYNKRPLAGMLDRHRKRFNRCKR